MTDDIHELYERCPKCGYPQRYAQLGSHLRGFVSFGNGMECDRCGARFPAPAIYTDDEGNATVVATARTILRSSGLTAAELTRLGDILTDAKEKDASPETVHDRISREIRVPEEFLALLRGSTNGPFRSALALWASAAFGIAAERAAAQTPSRDLGLYSSPPHIGQMHSYPPAEPPVQVSVTKDPKRGEGDTDSGKVPPTKAEALEKRVDRYIRQHQLVTHDVERVRTILETAKAKGSARREIQGELASKVPRSEGLLSLPIGSVLQAIEALCAVLIVWLTKQAVEESRTANRIAAEANEVARLPKPSKKRRR